MFCTDKQDEPLKKTSPMLILIFIFFLLKIAYSFSFWRHKSMVTCTCNCNSCFLFYFELTSWKLHFGLGACSPDLLYRIVINRCSLCPEQRPYFLNIWPLMEPLHSPRGMYHNSSHFWLLFRRCRRTNEVHQPLMSHLGWRDRRQAN